MTESSLRKYDDIIGRIILSKQGDRRVALVVEGPTDKRLLDRIGRESLVVFIAGTRSNVIAVAKAAVRHARSDIWGIADRDLDDVVEASSCAQLRTYDGADLEAALIEGPWFEMLLEEIASAEKIEKFGGSSEVRRVVREVAQIFAQVRRANALGAWGLNLQDDLPLGKKVASKDLKLDERGLVAAVRGLLRKAGREGADFELGDKRWVSERYRGRDALEVLRIGLAKVLGSSRFDSAEQLAASLRLAADARLLETQPFEEVLAA